MTRHAAVGVSHLSEISLDSITAVVHNVVPVGYLVHGIAYRAYLVLAYLGLSWLSLAKLSLA